MRRKHLTKIVATLGPASSDPKIIRRLFESGVDVFRLNFSHGTQEDKKDLIAAIRALEDDVGRPITVMMDLQGPKLRIGTFIGDKATLQDGAAFRLDMEDKPGDERRVRLPHKEIFQAIGPDTDLLVDDGRIRLRVKKSGADFAETEVVTGGVISNRKGVNVPGVVLPLSSLTEKDRSDLQFGLGQGVDYVALSFVQQPQDLADARRLIAGRAALLTKLEKPAAINSLHEIVEMSDVVMVVAAAEEVVVALAVSVGWKEEWRVSKTP
jgi:pyruvate kinase